MLIGIDPLLRGSLLAALDEMGHGDLLVVADANFPAHRISNRVIDIPCADAPGVMRAIASVFPIDPDVPVTLMESPSGRLPVQDELVRAADRDSSQSSVTALNRFAFYGEAAQAYLVLLTGERRPYGNILVRKGVV